MALSETQKLGGQTWDFRSPLSYLVVDLFQLIWLLNFAECNFRFPVMFGSLKLPTRISVKFSFDDFRIMAVSYSHGVRLAPGRTVSEG